MEYMTVREAADKWGVSVRRVQNLCGKGRISGAIRFNRSWAVPVNVNKPSDGRHKKIEESSDNRLQKLEPEAEGVFARVVEAFPYAIAIFATDGTLVYANEAYFKMFFIADRSLVLGKMNLLEDEITRNNGVAEYAKRALKGELVRIEDARIPIQEVRDKLGDGLLTPGIFYMDVTSFPVYYKGSRLAYTGTLFMPSRVYMGRNEVVKGKEYIENHWDKNFNMEGAATASGLSKAQFTKVFRKNTGMTPYEYYTKVKIDRIKEKLIDSNLSISQAFAACGVDYNGHYARIFKANVGQTPLQYRKKHI